MTGELDAWHYSLARAATRLVEGVWGGDSTSAGETLSAPLYAPRTRVRELLAAADIPDGGGGNLNGLLDTPEVSGEPSDAGVTAEPAYNINNGQNLQANYTVGARVWGQQAGTH